MVRSLIRNPNHCRALAWALLPLLAGCSASMIKINPGPDAGKATIDVTILRADNGEPLGVEATVVIGGEKATTAAGDQGVRVSAVPFGNSDPPTQPLTVNAEGFVTYFEDLQLNPNGTTQTQVDMEAADPSTTGTVSGAVTNLDSGNPVANVRLEFAPDIPGTPEGIKAATDNAGEYTVRGVPTGATLATATAQGFLTNTKQIVVAQGEGTNPALDFKLVATTSKANVSGRVTDLITRDPIEDASVTIGGVGPATTDQDGHFALIEVPVGDQTIQVTATDYDPFSDTVTVTPGMSDLQVQLAPSEAKPPPGPATISGTVTILNNPDNAGATVKAIDDATDQVIDTAVTNAAGEYGLFVPRGQYVIEVSFKGVTITKSVELKGAGRVKTGVDFVITAP
ncbi:MAG: hypothetical protein FJX75_00720 [Armatimonadetes bacterium]|nr:hypothetical protein [Armatimonadota bacterium]